MKYILTLLFLSISISSFENPVEIKLKKEKKDSYKLSVTVPKGYAIQKDAPNKISLTGDKTLEVLESDTKFKGQTLLDKPEYFSEVDEMKVKLKGKGELSIDSKIFYCDLNKNVCYPAKISKKVNVL
jgi:hypothetical protein